MKPIMIFCRVGEKCGKKLPMDFVLLRNTFMFMSAGSADVHVYMLLAR